jgi:hypothetical protein
MAAFEKHRWREEELEVPEWPAVARLLEPD